MNRKMYVPLQPMLQTQKAKMLSNDCYQWAAVQRVSRGGADDFPL